VIQEAEGETIEAMLGEENTKKVSEETKIKGERRKRRRRDRKEGRRKESKLPPPPMAAQIGEGDSGERREVFKSVGLMASTK
jgi:hypothetical protein